MARTTQTTLPYWSNPPVSSIQYYIDGFLLKQKSQLHSPNTIKYYEWDLRRFVWFLEEHRYPTLFKKITPNNIREFFVYLSTTHKGRWGSSDARANVPLSAGGIHAFARALRAFFRWASREARIPCAFDNVDMPKVPNKWTVERYTDDEVACLFDACEKMSSPFMRARARTVLAVLFDTGLRAAEMLSLRFSDVTADASLFKVTGKGGKTRFVILGQAARCDLMRYVLEYHPNSNGGNVDALFVTARKPQKPMKYDGLKEIFKELQALSGITRLTIRAHLCRHTAATLMHRNGMRLTTLQEVLGHASIDVTKHFYLDIGAEDLRAEHSQYGPLDNLRIKPQSIVSPVIPQRRPLPPPIVVLHTVQELGYAGAGRKYGYSDNGIRKYLKASGLI